MNHKARCIAVQAPMLRVRLKNSGQKLKLLILKGKLSHIYDIPDKSSAYIRIARLLLNYNENENNEKSKAQYKLYIIKHRPSILLH